MHAVDLITEGRELPDTRVFDGYIVVSNSDCTEGKGHPVYIAYARNFYTAKRSAQKRGVQGGPADITKERFIQIENTVYAPVLLEQPTQWDIDAEARRQDYEALREKAKTLGLTDEEIDGLTKGGPR